MHRVHGNGASTSIGQVKSVQKSRRGNGASDRIRTDDIQDHNLAL